MLITKISPVRGSKKRLCLSFDEADPVTLYAGEVRRLHLSEGAELSAEEYEDLRRTVLLPRAKKRVLHLLERQDYPEQKLKRKLLDGGYPEDLCEEAIRYAASFHYVDDRRYAANYIAAHQGQKSRRRLYEDLLRRGIKKELLEEVMEETYSGDEWGLILNLIEKKDYQKDSADAKERARMYRFLAGRGFSSELIRRAI